MSGRGNSSRGEPPDHQRSETPQRRRTGGSPDGNPGSDGSPDDGRHPPRRGPSRGGRPPGGGPPGPPGDPGPQGDQGSQVPLDLKDIEDPQAHKDL